MVVLILYFNFLGGHMRCDANGSLKKMKYFSEIINNALNIYIN